MPKENEQGQEKTEKPSEKRKRDARNDGNVARSQDLNSALVLIGGLSLLAIFGGYVMTRLMEFASGMYLSLDEIQLDGSNFRAYIDGTAKYLLGTIAPFFIIIPIIGVAASLMQFGFLFSQKALKPKFERLNPFKGMKNLFNQQAVVKLLMNIVKVTLIGYVAFAVVRHEYPKFVPLMDAEVAAIFLFLVRTILKVMIWTVVVLLILAIIDFTYQKYKYVENLKMSKQEVKDERKMMEGDPKVKNQQRQLQFRIAFNRMIKELPKADVVVTNPTHVAVALKYDPESMDAPRVVGKGLRKLAQRIKEVAREHGIPVIESPPLARSLYKHCEIGEEIPGEFYQDVAEIIAQIYRLREEEEVEETMA
ncbi:flagellar biosynthesis protein FlhB [bacterium]|nr:flagellar biosynthesis protein FlhB [bacterium]